MLRYQKRSASELTGLCPVSVGNDADALQAEISAGLCDFFTLGGTHYVVRGEITSRGKEFVICCAEGAGLKRSVKALISHAKHVNFDFIRYHPKTDRAGRAFLKMANMTGARVDEPGKFYYLVRL